MIYLNIEKLLKIKNKTRYWLMKEMDTSYLNLNKLYYNQVTAIRLETIEKLCNALECNISDLIIINDEKIKTNKNIS